MRQWVISVPKRLRGILADRPQAVTTLNMGVWLVFHQENVPDLFCCGKGTGTVC